MRRMMIPVFAVALAAMPVSLAAQTPDGARAEARHMMRRGDPITRLLERRAELGLTDEQVGRLEAIRSRLHEQNRPLLEKLGEARANRPNPPNGMAAEQRAEMRERWAQMTPEEREQHRAEMRQRMRERREAMTPEQREELRKRMEERRAEMRERMEALRPTLQQLRENQRAAMNEVREVLTDEQEAKLRELHEKRAAERGDRRGRRGAQHPHGEGARPQHR